LTALAIFATDTAGFLAALSFALGLGQLAGEPIRSHIVADGLAVTLASLLVLAANGLYPALGADGVLESRQLVKCVSVVHLANICLLFLAGADGYKIEAVAFAMVATAATPIGRSIVRKRFSRSDWWGESVLLIGSGRPVQEVADFLKRHPWFGLHPAAMLDESGAGERMVDVPTFQTLDEVLVAASKGRVQTAIVVHSDRRGAPAVDVAARYGAWFPRLIVLSPNFSRFQGSRGEKVLSGDLRRQVSRVLEMQTRRRAKRTVDVLAAGSLLTLLAPLMLLLTLAVKLTSRGPVLFRHKRVGRDGSTFMVCKFRTMVSDADARLAERLATSEEARLEWERDHKLRKDPRVTPIGGLLRKYSLDELPQLWNVLRAEMSLVGPRPISAQEIVKYGDHFSVYAKATPGITGLWQVSGRNETTYDERVALDAYYVENWSLWMDLHILAKTFGAVSSSRGAY
jgi:Undecaprenyl-phosphate galactose phosphotransferase WbaP